MKTRAQKSTSGKRDAVLPKSGLSVHPSDPGLKGPTIPSTAGRTPAACLIPQQGAETRPAALQHKTGAGRSPAVVAVACSSELDRESVDAFIAVFRLLDEWERKLHCKKSYVASAADTLRFRYARLSQQ
jgi:hypothetical protein